jgi:hypothetical protein
MVLEIMPIRTQQMGKSWREKRESDERRLDIDEDNYT